MDNFRHAARAGLISAVANAVLAAVKIVAGIFGNSYALVADGIESSADVVSSLVVWGGLRVATRPADDNHPYGHGKAESLAALAAAIALIVAALVIVVQSVREILTPHLAPKPFTLVVLALVVAAKWLLSRFIRAAGESVGSTALKSDAWHHLSDALSSLAAFVGISVALVAGEGYESADDWAALVACAIILFNGANLFKAAIDDLMDTSPSPELEGLIRRLARNVDGVVDIEKLRVRKSGLHNLIDIHVVVDGDISVREGHAIGHQVKDMLLESEHRVSDVLVHVEPPENTN